MKIYGFDPGLSTGWAEFNGSRLSDFGTILTTKKDMKPLYDWLSNHIPTEIVVIERYMIRPKGSGGFDHSWNSGDTLQVIGALKSWARDVQVVEQNSDIKVPAHGMIFGTPYKKKKGQHHLDAILHVGYYLIKSKTYKPTEIGGLG